jgi:DNA-directed RNA polymerase specialized sigma24 family protein
MRTPQNARPAFSLRETLDGLPEPYRSARMLTEYEGISLSATKSSEPAPR